MYMLLIIHNNINTTNNDPVGTSRIRFYYLRYKTVRDQCPTTISISTLTYKTVQDRARPYNTNLFHFNVDIHDC